MQLLLLCASGVLAQGETALVTPARLDAAAEQVSANRTEEDPGRAALLGQYDNIRATLTEIQGFQDSQRNFSNARANAADKARDVQLGLAERQVAVEHTDVQLATAALQELEQAIQLLGAELEARRSHLADTTGRINSAPGRALAIRERLARLGSRIPELESALALMPTDVVSGSKDEADLWLAQAQLASARAEKASLDEELLSQPMRLELLKAYRDQASRDIAAMERRLQALQRRAGELRQGAAVQAQAEARMAVADTAGKNPLLQELAERNAQLTDSFAERNSIIEDARQRDLEVTARADELVADLEEIERKLDLLGMNISVGQILREQQIQLPPKNASKREIAAVAAQITQSSLRQIELEDERRQLDDTGQYVDTLVQGQAEPVADDVHAGLVQLALARRGLIDQAIELEDTHAVALANLDFSLHRYAGIVADYRQFISERLLWIPSRTPLALFREGLPGEQLRSMFAPQRWLTVLGQIPGEIRQRPLLLVGVVLALLLWGASARLRTLVVNCGREVGYVGTDLFSNTVLALGLTLLLALRWPALMFSLGLAMMHTGRVSEALELAEQVYVLEPRASQAFMVLAYAYLYNGQVERALEEFEHGYALKWNQVMVALGGFTAAMVTRDPEVMQHWHQLVMETGELPPIEGMLPAMMERLDDPTAALAWLHEAFGQTESMDYFITLWAAYFGDVELALDAQHRTPDTWAFWNPLMADARKSPRFIVLVERIGLPDYWQDHGWSDFCAPNQSGSLVCH